MKATVIPCCALAGMASSPTGLAMPSAGRCGAGRILIADGTAYTALQSLWRTVGLFLIKVSTHCPYSPAFHSSASPRGRKTRLHKKPEPECVQWLHHDQEREQPVCRGDGCLVPPPAAQSLGAAVGARQRGGSAAACQGIRAPRGWNCSMIHFVTWKWQDYRDRKQCVLSLDGGGGYVAKCIC